MPSSAEDFILQSPNSDSQIPHLQFSPGTCHTHQHFEREKVPGWSRCPGGGRVSDASPTPADGTRSEHMTQDPPCEDGLAGPFRVRRIEPLSSVNAPSYDKSKEMRRRQCLH